jgi:single-strand DNA-binding protein
MNSVSLIGRLTRDPEQRYTNGGKAVANFSIAVDDGYGENKTTSFIPIVAWEKTAELAKQYLAKGSQVAVSGQLRQRSYEDRNGNKQTVTEIVARQLDFLTKAEKKARSQSEPGEFDEPARQVSDEDIPF